MKRCPQCNSENSDSMNFCLQCGAALPQPMVINLQNDPPPTQVYGANPQTNPGGARQTDFNNQPNFQQNFGGQQPPPQPKKSGSGKIFLIVGGIFALLLLFGGAIAAIVVYNLMNSKQIANNNTATPFPTRDIIIKNTPVPFGSPSPNVNPNATPTVKTATDPNGKIERTWVDYNITESERNGMRIHNKFRTFNLKDTECYLAIYFEKDDGTRLTSNDSSYKSQDGRLALFKLLKPNYDNTVYDDITVFLPYGEFDLPAGKHKLKIDVDLITKDGRMIQHMNYHNFEYERISK